MDILERTDHLYFTENDLRNEPLHMIYKVQGKEPITFITGPKSINYCKKMRIQYTKLTGMDSYWYLTERYIHELGMEDALYTLYQRAERFLEIQKLAHDTDMGEFIDIINDILEMFPYDKMLEMCNGLDLPMYNLSPISFDKSIENEQRGTRVQSYIRSDHIELIAFISYLRIISPFILGYMHININVIGKYHMEFKITEVLLHKTYLNNIPAFIKMEQSIGMSVRTAINKLPIEEIQRVIQSKDIDEESLPLYALSIALTHILLTYNVFKDDSTVTVMSIYTSKGINSINVTKTTNQLAHKRVASSTMDDEKSSSILETYKASTETSGADVALINAIYQDVNNYKIYGVLDKVVYDKIYKDLSVIYKSDDPYRNTLTKMQLDMICGIGMLVYDPIGAKVITSDSIHVLLSHIFTWLYMNGFKDIAYFLTSVKVVDNDLDISGNISPAIDKYTPSNLEELRKVYSYNNENGVTSEQLKANIDLYRSHMYSEKWFILASSFTDETYWTVPLIRDSIVDMYIALNKIYVTN